MGQALFVPAVFAALFFATTSLPLDARAFWPFSYRAGATVDIIPSASTPVLVAVRNSNPNAQAASPLPTSGDSALVPYTGPNGSPGDSVVRPVAEQISTYLVKEDDTLSEIADEYGVSVNTIIWANDLKSARDVHPGDTLLILPISGIEHTIVKGETLQSLAKKYGGDIDEIVAYNGLDASVSLAVGSTVIVPGGEITTVVKAPARAEGTGRGTVTPPRGVSGTVATGSWSNPLPGGRLSQGIHGWNGIDISAQRGTPIYAAAGGTVVVAKSNGAWNGGYGNYVVISQGSGIQSLYAHMTNTAVASGQAVSAGQIIGYVGTSGRATGPHLHFEVRGAANPFRNWF